MEHRTPLESWIEEAHRFVESPQSIVARAKPFADSAGLDSAGLYFIVHDFRIQYVGISMNLAWRLQEHWTRWRFDAFSVLAGIPEAFLSDLEEFYIAWLRPQANTRQRRTHLTRLLWAARSGEFGDPKPWVLSIDDVVFYSANGVDDFIPYDNIAYVAENRAGYAVVHLRASQDSMKSLKVEAESDLKLLKEYVTADVRG